MRTISPWMGSAPISASPATSRGADRERSATRAQRLGWNQQPGVGGCHAGVSHSDVFVRAGVRTHSRRTDLDCDALRNQCFSWHAVRIFQEQRAGRQGLVCELQWSGETRGAVRMTLAVCSAARSAKTRRSSSSPTRGCGCASQSTQQTVVPDAASRQQAPAAMRPYLNAFPIANGPQLGAGWRNSTPSYSNPSSLDATSIRVDHVINSKLNLFGRYNYSPSELGPTSAPSLARLGPQHDAVRFRPPYKPGQSASRN